MDVAMPDQTIAILGWGSLIWDKDHKGAKCFDKWHRPWADDGPWIKLEFSRISKVSRPGALTLVVDPVHGSMCQVAYCLSTRTKAEDAFEDLRKREGMPINRDGGIPRTIGRIIRSQSSAVCRDQATGTAIENWAARKKIDVVTWTDLPSNFQNVTRNPFSVGAVVAHLLAASPGALAATLEYLRMAPAAVQTDVRRALMADPRFT
jgi:cation transport regulator ChaC